MKSLLALLFFASSVTHAVTRDEFHAVIRIFENEFSRDAAQQGRRFEILHDWRENWAQAYARRWETDHLVVYGGVARMQGSTVDSFALVLCHEVGHLYAGEPYSDAHNLISVEGQADYWAAQECWDRIAVQLPGGGETNERLKDAALVLTKHFASSRNLPSPRFETPDMTMATSTNRTHPLPQCRLDTFLAGLNQQDRPRCWFAP